MSDVIIVNNSSETFTATSSGAIATHLWETARAARDTGVTVHIVTRDSDDASYDWPSLQRLPPLPGRRQARHRLTRRLTRTRELDTAEYATRVIKAVRRVPAPPDTPVLLHNDPELASVLACIFPRRRTVNLNHNDLAVRPVWNRIASRSSVQQAAVSTYIAAGVQSALRWPTGRVHIVPNGVDASRFTEPADGPVGISIPTISFVGRMGHEKGADLLLDACQLLRHQGLEFSLRLVGSNTWGRRLEDEYQTAIDRQVRLLVELGVHVVRTGHVSRVNIPDEFRRSDIQVVPSRWPEPFALVALEGMASGLALVVADSGGMPDVVGSAALLFPRENVQVLAAQLRRLVLDPELRRSLGRQGRVRALEFSWARSWQLLNALLTPVNDSERRQA